jgi:hypothetical protein
MPAFQHRHASHCESGVMAALVTHAGLPMSEPMAFGLASALAFAFIPIIKVGGQPLVAFRIIPRAIIRRLHSLLGLSLQAETFRVPARGAARLDALLGEGCLVGMQTSAFWLPYFPEDLRFHFNVHNVIAYGRDGEDYLLSDPVFEAPVRCPGPDLTRARFAKGLMAPKGLLYRIREAPREPRWAELLPKVIRRNCRSMLAPVPFAGAKGIRYLSRAVDRLDTGGDGAAARLFLGHLVRMQEEIGTGGAGFRFIYAAFLQEAAALAQRPALLSLADELVAIGDQWRELALASAMMIRGRQPLEPQRIAALLRIQADREETFFRTLRASV